jgi:methylthioribose-1-phosphate isomerase
MPTSTLDPTLADGSAIPIEERSAPAHVGDLARAADGSLVEVQLVPGGTVAANPAFDVTPARLVSSLITEHGVVEANAAALRDLWMQNSKGNE